MSSAQRAPARQRRPRPATRIAGTPRSWPARPPTPAQLATQEAHRQLEQAYRKLHRAEAYAATLATEYARTDDPSHRRPTRPRPHPLPPGRGARPEHHECSYFAHTRSILDPSKHKQTQGAKRCTLRSPRPA